MARGSNYSIEEGREAGGEGGEEDRESCMVGGGYWGCGFQKERARKDGGAEGRGVRFKLFLKRVWHRERSLVRN